MGGPEPDTFTSCWKHLRYTGPAFTSQRLMELSELLEATIRASAESDTLLTASFSFKVWSRFPVIQIKAEHMCSSL